MKFLRSVYLGWAILLMSGCAASKQLSGPNGEILHSIDCSGYMNNMGTCLEKAGKICGPHGYDLLLGGTQNHGTGMSGGQFGLFAAPIVSREIIIRCKDPSGIQRSSVNTPDTHPN